MKKQGVSGGKRGKKNTEFNEESGRLIYTLIPPLDSTCIEHLILTVNVKSNNSFQ